jgi:stearoyl-CoA desaturase (delta-9 desaturase)
MEKNIIIKNIFKMYCVLPINVFGIYAIYTLFIGQGYSGWWISTLIGYVCMMMLGIAGCYHRLLSHRGYTVNRFTKIILLWFAAIAGQGSPMFWVGVHRGYHHRYADTEKDPHSPIHGFWNSYILWMFKTNFDEMNVKSIVDLFKDKDCVFFHNHYAKIFFLSHFLIALFSFEFWLYAMALPAFLTLHANSLNTSLNHYNFMGYKNYEIKDRSVNSIWLFPFIQGEAWHNNHHGDPKNPNYGHRRWWELDPTYYLIKLIEKK